MSLAVSQVNGTTQGLQDVLRRLFQSGVFSKSELAGLSWYVSNLILSGTTEEQRKQNADEFSSFLFSPNSAAEVAARARLAPLQTSNGVHINGATSIAQTNGRYSPDKELVDYLKLDKPIVFFDLETAGWDSDEHKIVEISAVKFYPDGKKEALTQRINPEVKIQKEAAEKHGIKDEDIKDKPIFKDLAPTIYKFFEGCHLGGFNILTFDIRILQKEFERVGIEFSKEGREIIDPMFIYHKKVKYEEGKKRDLTAAYKYYCGRDLINAHQAKADIEATIEVLKGQFEMYPDLPRELTLLSDFCQRKRADFFDKDGKFVWGRGEIIFNFGKYKDQALKNIVESPKGKEYVEWMLRADFSDEVKELLRNALNGNHPVPMPPSKNGKPVAV